MTASDSTHPRHPGAPHLGRFGPFVLKRELGRGGMGVVYLAEQSSLRREVALKILASDDIITPEMQARFRREAEAASRVSHPGLARIYDFGVEDGKTYIAMEFVSGVTFSQILASTGALEPPVVLDLTRQILEALAALHQAGIVHRDLKPGNIMLGNDARVRIMDLGLVLVPDRTALTRPGMVVGTPQYMTPEIVLGNPADHRTDLYQVGLVAYELLTGAPRFLEATVPDLIARIATADVPELPPLPAPEGTQVGALLAGLLARDPEERLPDARAALAVIGPPARTEPAIEVESGSSRTWTDIVTDRSTQGAEGERPRGPGAPWLMALFLTLAAVAIPLGIFAGSRARLPPREPDRPSGSVDLPGSSGPAPAAVRFAPGEERQTLEILCEWIQAMRAPGESEEVREDHRDALMTPTLREPMRKRWTEYCQRTLDSPSSRNLLESYRTIREGIMDSPEIPLDLRALTLFRLHELEDFLVQVRIAFGVDPHLEARSLHPPLTVPGPGRPPGATPWQALVFQGGRIPDPLASAPDPPEIVTVPGGNEFSSTGSGKVKLLSPSARKSLDWPMRSVPPGRIVRRAYMECRWRRGLPGEKLGVKIAFPGAVHGHLAAVFRAAGGVNPESGWVRIDERFFRERALKWSITFHGRALALSPEGIQVDYLILWLDLS